MRKLSFWASTHAWSARLIIIILIYPLLNISGWFIGDLLAQQEVHINPNWGYPLSLICLFLCVIYPFRGDRFRHRLIYEHKRSIDILLIATTACFILLRGNNFISGASSEPVTTAAASSGDASTLKPGHPLKMKKTEKNLIKKLLKRMRSQYRKSDKTEKALLIVLGVIIFILAFYALAALSCSLACSGSEGLAYVVFFLGLGGLIFLLVRFIQRVTRGPRKKVPETKTL